MFKSFDKLIRAGNLYQGRGEVMARILDDAANEAVEATREGPVTVTIAPFGLVFGGRPLWEAERRTPYLFRLFCDGFREVTFLEGITKDELAKLAAIIGAEHGDDGEDFVTRLWSAGLDHVRYYATDAFAAGIDVDGDGDAAMSRPLSQLAPGGAGPAVQMTADDLRMIDADLRLGWVEQCIAPPTSGAEHEPQTAPLRATFHQPTDGARFLSLALGNEGASAAVPVVLELIDGAAGPQALVPLLNPLARGTSAGQATATAIFDALMTPERMAVLAPIYCAAPDALLPLLCVRPRDDGAALVAMLNACTDETAAAQLRQRLQAAGVDMVDHYAHLLEGGSESDLLEAVSALSTSRGPRAAVALGKALPSQSESVRRAALVALRGRYDDELRQPLGRALRDPVREHRLMAVEILAQAQDPRVVASFLSAVQESVFLERDEGEQGAFFGAIALFRDPRTLSYFEHVLSERNLTRKKSSLSRQLLAVRALSAMGTPQARVTLAKAGRKWFHPPEIKEAVEAALS